MRVLFAVLCVALVVNADIWSDIVLQATRTSKGNVTQYPDSTHMQPWTGFNPWRTLSSSSWTCGFFPGLLWQLYTLTTNTMWKGLAMAWTEGIRSQQFNTGTHDVGFMVFTSFGKGVEAGVSEYKSVVFQAAESLSTRFNPTVGCTKSWNNLHACRLHPTLVTQFPVIIDNMMNLELLLWVSANGGDPKYQQMAISHADTTAKHHVRDDGSTFHVVDYNPDTGAMVIGCTAQGYADNSTWSRGQSWCIYGFTMVHRYTGLSRFLDTAMRCADFWLNHTSLTPDPVPLWDFSWPGAQTTHDRDSSAGAVAASGLTELAAAVEQAGNKTAAAIYRNAAFALTARLTGSSYLASVAATEGIILHGTGSFMTNSSVDVSLVYGDYYLAEALYRQAALKRS